MNEYKINYREYNGKKLLQAYDQSACFSDIFSRGCLAETTDIILYEEPKNFNIPIEDFKKWVEGLNEAGFPCEYLGNSTEDEAAKFDFKKEFIVVNVPVKKYKNITHLTAGLSNIRCAYDYADGHMGSKPYKICENYLAIREKYNVDAMSAIIGACNMYGAGGGHQTHNSADLKLHTIEDFIKAAPNTSIRNGGRNLHNTSNKFKSGKIYKTLESLSELYAGLKGEPIAEKKLKVYVVGGDVNYANWLPDCKIVDTLKEAELVLFTGGEDVSPNHYGEPKHPNTYNNPARDTAEKRIFTLAKNAGKKILGICRGSQFVCVMSGGKLVQHQQNKKAVHPIQTTNYGDVNISSTHHQAQFPFNLKKWDYKIIGWTTGISDFHQDGEGEELNPPYECEIVYYPKTKALGIQGHPEFLGYQREYPEDLKVFKKIFNDFITDKL